MKRKLLAGLATALVFVLVATIGDPVMAGEARTAIKIGTPPHGFFHLPILVAKDRGMFAAEGLEATIINMRGGSEAAAALANKNIDVMMSAISHAINLWEKGVKVKVLVLNQAPRSFTFVVDAKRHPDVTTIDQLRGKNFRIAIPRRGSDGDQLIRYLLAWQGMNPETDVSLIQIPGYQNHLTALEKGEIDGSIILEPFTTMGIRRGLARSLVDLFQGEGPDLLKKRVWVGLMVTEEDFQSRRDLALKLVKATVRAIEFINTDEAGTLELAKKHFPSIDAAVLPEILRRHKGAFRAEVTREAIEADNQFLKELGMLKTPQRYEDVVALEVADLWTVKR